MAEKLIPIGTLGETSAHETPGNDGPGERIREMRKVRQMTLQQLADQVGISIGHLSQIERNQAQLSVASLKAISDALGVQIGYFFDEAGQRISAEHKIVVREGARQKLRYAKTGVLDELLVPDLNGPIEMLMSYYLPGADTEFYSHVGVEAGLVVQGELELTVGNDVFILKEGDSFTFRSTEMHRSRNLSDKEVRVVWVITPPAF